MERLQHAIEKARAARDQSDPPVRADAAAPPPPAAEAWAALAPLEFDRKKLGRHRLVALEGGKDAAPYDILRTRIIQQAATHGWRRVAVVSPQAGSGKTTALANLLCSFSRQLDLSVVALDMDLRRSNLMKVFGQEPETGMAELLNGRTDFADTGRRLGSNVALAFNNAPVTNSAELLQSQRTRDALAAIEARYSPDLMLFDTAPLIGVDDTSGFLRGNVDAALMVVAADETPVEQIDLAERQLAEVTNVMGVVLNKARFIAAEHYY